MNLAGCRPWRGKELDMTEHEHERMNKVYTMDYKSKQPLYLK